jgi:hypothetical protein
MLLNTYTLGTSGDQLVFDKQFDDKGASYFSVAGLTPSTKKTLTISHQPASNGSVRTLVDLTETFVNPSSVTGATADQRVFFVIQRPSFGTAAAIQSARVRLKTLVDDSAFWAKLLNQEV